MDHSIYCTADTDQVIILINFKGPITSQQN